MIVLLISLLSYHLEQDWIRSINDLDKNGTYYSKEHDSFYHFKGNLVRGGFVVGSSNNDRGDVPQFTTQVENCSTSELSCRHFSLFDIVAPKKNFSRTMQSRGISISLSVDNSGNLAGKGWCGQILREHCGPSSKKFPEMEYEYTLDASGTMTTFSETYYTSEGDIKESISYKLIGSKGLLID